MKQPKDRPADSRHRDARRLARTVGSMALTPLASLGVISADLFSCLVAVALVEQARDVPSGAPVGIPATAARIQVRVPRGAAITAASLGFAAHTAGGDAVGVVVGERHGSADAPDLLLSASKAEVQANATTVELLILLPKDAKLHTFVARAAADELAAFRANDGVDVTLVGRGDARQTVRLGLGRSWYQEIDLEALR